jgi:hypothetical protein
LTRAQAHAAIDEAVQAAIKQEFSVYCTAVLEDNPEGVRRLKVGFLRHRDAAIKAKQIADEVFAP